MAISSFYITFGFSNSSDFSGETTQTVSVRIGDMNEPDESETRIGGGGKMLPRNSLLRGQLNVVFMEALTTADAAYPAGFDEGDLTALRRNFAKYTFKRITASNLQCFAEFAAEYPLPWQVEHTGDWMNQKNANRGWKTMTTTFEAVEYTDVS